MSLAAAIHPADRAVGGTVGRRPPRSDWSPLGGHPTRHEGFQRPLTASKPLTGRPQRVPLFLSRGDDLHHGGPGSAAVGHRVRPASRPSRKAQAKAARQQIDVQAERVAVEWRVERGRLAEADEQLAGPLGPGPRREPQRLRDEAVRLRSGLEELQRPEPSATAAAPSRKPNSISFAQLGSGRGSGCDAGGRQRSP